MDNSYQLMPIISFIALLVAIVGGWIGIRKNLRDYAQDAVSVQLAVEHRLTQLETNVNWIKDHLPKRKGDINDT